MTWNNAPAAQAALLASPGAVNVDIWYEVDVTSLVTVVSRCASRWASAHHAGFPA